MACMQIKGTVVKVASDVKFSLWPEDLYTTEYIPDLNEIKKRYKGKPASEYPNGVEIITSNKVVLK